MTKSMKVISDNNREAMALGVELTQTLSALLLQSYYDHEETTADRKASQLWAQDLAVMERSNLTNDERFDIDEHHGEMMCLITDQAFIAGLFAGLKMAALTEVTLDSARQAEN